MSANFPGTSGNKKYIYILTNDSCVYLCSYIAEKVFDVFPYEKILHDGLPIVLQNQLELVDVVVLVRGYEIRHCHDFRVVFVRLRLLKEVPSVRVRMYFSG